MAEIQTGLAVVWGITTNDTAAAQLLGIGTGKLRHTGQNYGREADTVEHKEKNGEVEGVTTFNQRETLELTVYPCENTRLKANSANIVPVPGARILIIDADTDIGAASTGKPWYVASASKVKSTDDKVVFTISCRRWAGISNAAPPANNYEPITP